MDPLSITASVIGIGGTVATVVKALKDIADKLSKSDLTLLSICSESSSVHAALGQIETIFRRHEQELLSRFDQQPALASAFDTALTGCALLYSVLENEVQHVNASLRKDGSMDWSSKFKVVWKQEDMERLVGQIRGQSAALNLLLQGLQTQSIFDLQMMLRSQGETLTKVQNDTRSLREKYPDSEVPESILGSRKTAESVFGGASATDDGAEFAFDDLIVNSKAYRRAMALAEAQIRGKVQLDVEQIEERPVTVAAENSSSGHAIITPERTILEPDSSMGDTQATPITASELSQDDHSNPPVPLLRPWKTPLPLNISHPEPGDGTSANISWLDAFNISHDDLKARPRNEIAMQHVFWEIITTEYGYIRSLRDFAELYKKTVQQLGPQSDNWQTHFSTIFDGVRIITDTHEQLVYRPLWEIWDKGGAFAAFSAEPFLKLLTDGELACTLYIRQFPFSYQLMRLETRQNEQFHKLLDRLREHQISNKLGWDHWMKAPITRLQRYSLLINTLGRQAASIGRDDIVEEAQRAYHPLMAESTTWDAALREGEVNAKTKLTYLQLDADSRPQLKLPSGRRIEKVVARGYLPYKFAGEAWTYMQVILQDGQLLLARDKNQLAAARRPSRLSWRGSEREVKVASDNEILESTQVKALKVISRLTLAKGSCKLAVEDPIKLSAFSSGRGELPSGITLYPLRLSDGDRVHQIGFFGDARTGAKVRNNFYREDWYLLIEPMLKR